MSDTPPPRRISIDPLTVTSLLVVTGANDNVLSSATGFVVLHEDRPFLITNWHVLTGRHADSGELLSTATGAVPDILAIFHHAPERLGARVKKIENLYDPAGVPRWIEHPKGREIDVVALPLHELDGVELRAFDLGLADTDVETLIGMPVSIIGFPFGIEELGEFPIWKTGHIATEPQWNFKGRPVFLVDATTRGGMSGSPVVLRRSDGVRLNEAQEFVHTSPVSRFLGIYASRPDASLELGSVWKPNVIHEILAQAV